MKLSVVLTVWNEEKNIGDCLESVSGIADEIVIVDERSEDKTVEIAKKFGAEVILVTHQDNFHINKQKALEAAKGEWILQLDADERVTPELAKEIKKTIGFSENNLRKKIIVSTSNTTDLRIPTTDFRLPTTGRKFRLFSRYQELIEKRDGIKFATGQPVVGFFVPRLNMFLGKPMKYGGVYPDAVIRLVKNGKARFPTKSVHELIEVDGGVGWLTNDLLHYDSPTLKRYLERNKRYVDLLAEDLKRTKVPVNLASFLKYVFLLPISSFLLLFIRHKSILDGYRGFIWSLFSALRFPRAYLKYWQSLNH